MPSPTDHNWFSQVAAPLVVDNDDSFSWDRTADVVVVGFGGAGASAAIEAVEQGADVIAIDRFRGGGATQISGGIFYCGGGIFYPYQSLSV